MRASHEGGNGAGKREINTHMSFGGGILIERKLTFAVVFAVAVETGGIFMWAGGATERLKDLEVRVAQQADMAERLARVEVQLQLASAQLDRIEKKLDARR